MAFFLGSIDTYFINMLSPKSYGGRRLMNLNGSFGKAIVWFLPDNVSLPDNKKIAEKTFNIFYHISDWAALTDLLRNEKPVYFNFNDSDNSAQIYTGTEPVGEEENT